MYIALQLSNTGFSVCVVIAEGDEVISVDSYHKLPKALNYHRLDLYAQAPTCSDFGRLSIKSKLIFLLVCVCFLINSNISHNFEILNIIWKCF